MVRVIVIPILFTPVWFDWRRLTLFIFFWSFPSPLPSTRLPNPFPNLPPHLPRPKLQLIWKPSANLVILPPMYSFKSILLFPSSPHLSPRPLQHWSSSFSVQEHAPLAHIWPLAFRLGNQDITSAQWVFVSFFFEHLLWVKNCTMFWTNNKEIKQIAHIEPMVRTHDLTLIIWVWGEKKWWLF